MNINSKTRLFLKVLDYAYSKSEFTRDDLVKALDINTPEQLALFTHFFSVGTGDTYSLLLTLPRNGVDMLMLSRAGEELALEYTVLKEARKSSNKAMYIAVGSLVIATIVGIAQIIVQIYFK